MPYVTINGIKGKFFVPPEKPASLKKHPCKDCFSCQQCGETRCTLCKGKNSGVRIRESK